MTDLRTAAQQALEALKNYKRSDDDRVSIAMGILSAALAKPEGGGNLPPPLQGPTVAETATTQQPVEQTPPSEYRRGYWDGFAIGKREGRIEAEDALAESVQKPIQECYGDCPTEPSTCANPCNFEGRVKPVQKPTLDEAMAGPRALAQAYENGWNAAKATGDNVSPTDPVAWMYEDTLPKEYPYDTMWPHSAVRDGVRMFPVFAPPQRKPLTEEEIRDCFQQRHRDKAVERRMITRAIERAHGIGGNDGQV